MENRKIVFFLGSMRRGGAERVISILSDSYAKKGWQTDVGLLLFNEVDYDINESVRIKDFTGYCDSRIKRVPYWLKNIRKYGIIQLL